MVHRWAKLWLAHRCTIVDYSDFHVGTYSGSYGRDFSATWKKCRIRNRRRDNNRNDCSSTMFQHQHLPGFKHNPPTINHHHSSSWLVYNQPCHTILLNEMSKRITNKLNNCCAGRYYKSTTIMFTYTKIYHRVTCPPHDEVLDRLNDDPSVLTPLPPRTAMLAVSSPIPRLQDASSIRSKLTIVW